MKNPLFEIVLGMDRLWEKSMDALQGAGAFDRAAAAAYVAFKATCRAVFRTYNDLKVFGADSVPRQGGLIVASNHQSYIDVPLLVAGCPRRVCFLAKSEFQDWPMLRQLVRFSNSIYVHRGGDDHALALAIEALRQGSAVALYPEGTIPGEEDIGRRYLEPSTGLLRGYSGAIRLALGARVPIVPLGVSGASRALPPEVFPRLELLRAPAPTPITLRFGEPISLAEWYGQDISRELLRKLTNELMLKISSLVDHRASYVPINVPFPPPPKIEKLGVLVLHGFSSHLDSISSLAPVLERAGIPFDMPVLRGHMTRYEDLSGVVARDWYVDAERALIDLLQRADQVVVVGFSMGGLVALELAVRHPDKLAGLVTVAAALKFADPLARFARKLSALVKYWPAPDPFNDSQLALHNRNYEKFPVETFASLYDYSREILGRLGEVHVPIRIIHSKADKIVAPVSANLIYDRVASQRRDISWYAKSGHEMLQDLEAEAVVADIMDFIKMFKG